MNNAKKPMNSLFLNFLLSSQKEIVNKDTNDKMVYAVIRIPKESKKKIRDQFELLGMTDSFIFPDDIAKVFNGI